VRTGARKRSVERYQRFPSTTAVGAIASTIFVLAMFVAVKRILRDNAA
jgi:hypothetical protein